MIRGLYTAATNMRVNEQKMNVVSNNLTNSTTAGYKKDGVISRSFPEMLTKAINDPSIVSSRREVGPLGLGIHVDQIMTAFEQGSIQSTERNTDFAINGDGFFVVETPEGERLTRDGSFKINADGYLVTDDGDYVLGENGRIQVNAEDFTVDRLGNVASDGEDVDKMRLVTVSDYGSLRKQGNNLYMNYGGATLTPADGEIKQGYTEGSNVDMASEMVEMMTIFRNYESNQKIINMIDSTLAKSVELGKV